MVAEGVRDGQGWRLRHMHGGSVGAVVTWRVRSGTGRGAGKGRWWSRWGGRTRGRTLRRGRAGSARRGLGKWDQQYGKRSTQRRRSSWGGSEEVEGAGAGAGGRETGVVARTPAGGAGAGDADAIVGE
jgi:hypothetical protein